MAYLMLQDDSTQLFIIPEAQKGLFLRGLFIYYELFPIVKYFL